MAGPTLSDIAQNSNVSLATVDRVINGRSGVSDRARQRVLGAAKQLGYILSDDVSMKSVTLAFVLPEGTNSFVDELADQAVEQAQLIENVQVCVERVTGFDPVALSEKILSLEGRVDGMAILAMDHPIAREAVRGIVNRGMAIATIGSDVHTVNHLGYVGIDDMQAGRLAGYILGRLIGDKPAKVAFFAGSLSYRGHQEREMGFRQILRDDFSNLQIVAHCEVQDNRAKAEVEMVAILDRHPDLSAVYNAGGGTTGIAIALRAKGVSDRVNFVAHDATAGNKALLLNGTLDAVLDQNARLEIRETLMTLVHAVRNTPYRMVPPRLQIILRENLPIG